MSLHALARAYMCFCTSAVVCVCGYVEIWACVAVWRSCSNCVVFLFSTVTLADKMPVPERKTCCALYCCALAHSKVQIYSRIRQTITRCWRAWPNTHHIGKPWDKLHNVSRWLDLQHELFYWSLSIFFRITQYLWRSQLARPFVRCASVGSDTHHYCTSSISNTQSTICSCKAPEPFYLGNAQLCVEIIAPVVVLCLLLCCLQCGWKASEHFIEEVLRCVHR